MNMETRNLRSSQGRMRHTGAIALALLMLILPITAVGAFALTGGDESQVDVTVVRARAGQYAAVASGKPELFFLTSGVDPMGPVHGGGYAISAESESFALTSGIDPAGPVHGGGYVTSAGSGVFAQGGSDLPCLAWAELDLAC